MSKPILWIVIPCYNEEQVLPITAPLFLKKINDLAAAGLVSEKSRVLFVNDGSRDATWSLIQKFASEDEHFIGISQSRNRGHQNAVLAGLMEALHSGTCDVTISIDCDGQDDINAMDEMVKKYLDGAEVVYGVRSRRDTDTFFKRFTAEGFYHVMNALGADIVFNHADYRLISTRVLEIYGGPFETEEQASLMHQESTQNFGWAGPEFIEHVLKVSEKSICDKYDEMLHYVMSIAKGKSGSHVAGISAVALADAMIDTWFFDNQDAPEPEADPKKEKGKDDEKQITINQESWDRAKRMAASILQEQIAAASGDVNENAVQFITDWVISNKAYFGEKAIGTCLGTMSESGNVAYIFPSTLNQALTKAGYSPRKTLKYMADNGLIATASEGSDSKQRYSVKRRFDGRSCRFVEFKIGQFSEKDDDIESEADKYEQESFTDSDGFMSIPEGMEEELPFK